MATPSFGAWSNAQTNSSSFIPKIFSCDRRDAALLWQIGGDKKGATTLQATRGQELIDLKKARDQGAISDDGYQSQRRKIIER